MELLSSSSSMISRLQWKRPFPIECTRMNCNATRKWEGKEWKSVVTINLTIIPGLWTLFFFSCSSIWKFVKILPRYLHFSSEKRICLRLWPQNRFNLPGNKSIKVCINWFIWIVSFLLGSLIIFLYALSSSGGGDHVIYGPLFHADITLT